MPSSTLRNEWSSLHVCKFQASVFSRSTNCSLQTAKASKLLVRRFAGMYSSLPYALAQGDVEIPYLILQSVIYSVITYWLIRYSSDVLFLMQHLIASCFPIAGMQSKLFIGSQCLP